MKAKHGRSTTRAPYGATVSERLIRLMIIDDAGCWAWQGCRRADGYPLMHVAGATRQAHRVSYELARGPIPEGYEVDHLCRKPECINPDHLEAVTPEENQRRRRDAITHCKHGHEFTPENTYVDPKRGDRKCRACGRRHQANRRRRMGSR